VASSPVLLAITDTQAMDDSNSELTNPHDRFFKDLMTRPEATRDFLTYYLPLPIIEALDIDQIEFVKDSFIDAHLREHFSDLVYRIGLKNGNAAIVYLLFEHKSTPEPMVALQLLRYIVRIWEQSAREAVKHLPPIFPLVFYHGEEPWTIDRQFSSLVALNEAPGFREYTPEFRYHLCDLSQYDDADIIGGALLQVGLRALKYYSSEELVDELVEILMLFHQMPQANAMESATQ